MTSDRQRPFAEIAAESLRHSSVWRRMGRYAVPIAGRYLLLNSMLRAGQRRLPLVLCYHGVVPDRVAADPFGYGNLISVSEFSRQMAMLARRMRPIDVPTLRDWLTGGTELPTDSVLVTFDDGYRNNLRHASPILARFGIPAIFFVTSGYVGSECLLWPTEVYRRVLLWPSHEVPLPDGSTLEVPKNEQPHRMALATWVRECCKLISDERTTDYLNRLRESDLAALTEAEEEMFAFLNWDEVRHLRRMGFEIGSHTTHHRLLTRISHSQLREELFASKVQIEEELQFACISLAYPNGSEGDYSPEVLAASADAGYKLGFTTRSGPCVRSVNPLTVNRICLPGQLSNLEFQSRVSCLHDRLKQSILSAKVHRPALETKT
jgi:peptidoglycan/xylan/chitin deacetylase (PgdA/CDA1 family)